MLVDISTLNSHYERLQQLSKNEGTLDGLKSGAANCTGLFATEIAELEASIKDYITQCQAKWVAGQSDINADWDGYLEQLDKLGLDQYLEYKGAVKAE